MRADIAAEVRRLTDHPPLIDFVDFVFAAATTDYLPDFDRIDMMQRPRLVPKMFVLDLRDGYESGLLFKFSGTQIDEHFGGNVQGRYLEDVYRGDRDVPEMRAMYIRCIEHREVYFRRRESTHEHRVWGIARGAQDLVIIPAISSKVDPSTVSFVVGMANFMVRSGVTETREVYLPLTG